MQKSARKFLFREGDRVGPLYSHPNEIHGTFLMYCPGYLSHCVVRWDGNKLPQRVKVDSIRLLTNGGPWND